MSTCNRLDLQTLGSQPIMPKNFPRSLTRIVGTQTTSSKVGQILLTKKKPEEKGKSATLLFSKVGEDNSSWRENWT
jgi:hypothetical protein